MIAATGLMAAEHHGMVKSSGLPVPGATVTVVQGTKKAVTTTDERGAYSFPDLASGVWSIDIEMLGFAKLHDEVAVGTDIAPPPWELALLPASAVFGKKGTVTEQAATKPAAGPRAPAPTAATRTASQRAGMNGRNGNGYQRLDVNPASMGNIGVSNGNGNGNDLNLAELNQSAADSMLVSGSLSRGLDMPTHNDWFGPGGFMPGPPGMGGPMGGPNGEPPTGGPGFSAMGPAAGMTMGGPGRGGMMGGPMAGGPGGGRGGPGGRRRFRWTWRARWLRWSRHARWTWRARRATGLARAPQRHGFRQQP